MNRIKEEKGITILALVIIVILLIMIASVMANFSNVEIDSSVDAKYEGELRMVQYAVLQQYSKYKVTKDESNIIYTRDYNSSIIAFKDNNYKSVSLSHIPSNDDEAYKRYYYITPSDLKKIGIQDSIYAYIINYYTGEVFNADVYKSNANRSLYLDGRESDTSSASF